MDCCLPSSVPSQKTGSTLVFLTVTRRDQKGSPGTRRLVCAVGVARKLHPRDPPFALDPHAHRLGGGPAHRHPGVRLPVAVLFSCTTGVNRGYQTRRDSNFRLGRECGREGGAAGRAGLELAAVAPGRRCRG